MSSTITPNMGLTLPTVSNQPGPLYAVNINADLTLIDGHTHLPGSGVQITPPALNINTDLTFNSNNAIDLRSARFTPQGSPLALANDLDCVYVSGVDLYYNDGNGNQVRITQAGGIAGSPGSISNLIPPASASYNSGSSTFIWQSDVNKPANMDFASAIFRNLTTGSNGVTVQAASALASNYSLTLPTLPVSQSFLTLNAAGIMATPVVYPLVSAGIAANTIVAGNIAPNTITTNEISLTAGITQGQLADAAFEWKTTTISIAVPSFTVRVATTVNGALGTAFDNASVVDGVTLATNDIILIKNQTAASENGVYNVQASGAPVRNASYDTFTELNNAAVLVTAGTTNSRQAFFQNATLTSLSDNQSWSINSNWTYTVPSGVNRLFYFASGGGAGGGGAAGAAGGTNNGSGAGGSGSIPVYGHYTVTPAEVLTGVLGGFGRGGTGGAATPTAGQSGSDGGATTILSSVSTLNIKIPGGSGGGGGGANISGAAVNTLSPISGYDYWNGLVPTQAGTAGDGNKGNNVNGTDANQNIYTQTPATHGVTGGARGASGGAGGSCFGSGGAGGNGNTPDTDGGTAVNAGAGGGGAGGKANANVSAGKNGGAGCAGQIILYYQQGT